MAFTVTIVTVCYNAEKTIETTLLSVLGQTYRSYEYIIIDGKSSDHTNMIIQKYLPAFERKGICVKYISEKDDGIYYAMNKAIDMAEGTWIAFMNADDSYYDDHVLENVFANKLYSEYDVVYGSANLVSETGSRIQAPHDLDIIRNQSAFIHQSSFTRTELMKNKKFDITYQLAADYQFFLELWLERRNFYCVKDVVISNFSVSGLSSIKGYETIAETRKIRYKHRIPGNNRVIDFMDYTWWVGVHLGGRRIKRQTDRKEPSDE
jgi:glycosyltransferase involved in cell wall biosynthesis